MKIFSLSEAAHVRSRSSFSSLHRRVVVFVFLLCTVGACRAARSWCPCCLGEPRARGSVLNFFSAWHKGERSASAEHDFVVKGSFLDTEEERYGRKFSVVPPVFSP